MQKIAMFFNPPKNFGVRKRNQIVKFRVEHRILLRELQRIFRVCGRFAGQANNEKKRHVIADVARRPHGAVNLFEMLALLNRPQNRLIRAFDAKRQKPEADGEHAFQQRGIHMIGANAIAQRSRKLVNLRRSSSSHSA